MDKILVVDFGSQYNQLICRRIREFGVYAELVSIDSDLSIYEDDSVKGIIFSGSPKSVYADDAYTINQDIYKIKKPLLGICYGLQRVVTDFGGLVEPCEKKEYGFVELEVLEENPLFEGTPKTQQIWMSHGDQATKMPEGFKLIASTSTCKLAGLMKDDMYLIQYHPEVVHTVYGNDILKNFVLNICKASQDYSMDNYVEQLIENIRAEVGDKKVLCGLSGGVDSSVVAALVHKAIGDNLTCMFIDHGLLRKYEREDVERIFRDNMHINLVTIDAKDRFLGKLAGVSDPEKKRKIIGNEFVYCFDEESNKLGSFDYLAQGTLYTDVIESGATNTSHVIKSHHNVGGLPKEMKFKLLEPLNTLFKDEVRALGRVLGLPDEMVDRKPFPGPGLAIRIIGDVTEDKLRIVKDSDYILKEELIKSGEDKKIWQYFTVLTNIQSVGVMGDARTYDYTLGIRAVTSIDGMTADFARIDWDVLQKASSRITNEVKGVNRVVYDVTSKPPATIEWE